MKQLLKDTTALVAIAGFVAAIDAWARGSSAVPHAIITVASATWQDLSERVSNISTLEACALIYAIWVGSSFYAVLVEHFSHRPRHILVSTLMFGSFGTTVAAMGVIILAGLRA